MPRHKLAPSPWGDRRNVNGTGDPTNSLIPQINRGFTGHEHLDQGFLGLIHMNGRVYDPALGRFLSPDPFIQAPYSTQSHQRYSYVANNPLNATDPSGYIAIINLSGATGAFTSFMGGLGGWGGPAGFEEIPKLPPVETTGRNGCALCGGDAQQFIENMRNNARGAEYARLNAQWGREYQRLGNIASSSIVLGDKIKAKAAQGALGRAMAALGLAAWYNSLPLLNPATVAVALAAMPSSVGDGTITGEMARTAAKDDDGNILLYRAVSLPELASIKASNAFLPAPNGSEMKQFWLTPTDATSFSQIMNQIIGTTEYQAIVQVGVSARTFSIGMPGSDPLKGAARPYLTYDFISIQFVNKDAQTSGIQIIK